MKVLSVFSLCAILFFALTYSSPCLYEELVGEIEEQAIEQADGKKALTQQNLFDQLRALSDSTNRQIITSDRRQRKLLNRQRKELRRLSKIARQVRRSSQWRWGR